MRLHAHPMALVSSEILGRTTAWSWSWWPLVLSSKFMFNSIESVLHFDLKHYMYTIMQLIPEASPPH